MQWSVKPRSSGKSGLLQNKRNQVWSQFVPNDLLLVRNNKVVEKKLRIYLKLLNVSALIYFHNFLWIIFITDQKHNKIHSYNIEACFENKITANLVQLEKPKNQQKQYNAKPWLQSA